MIPGLIFFGWYSGAMAIFSTRVGMWTNDRYWRTADSVMHDGLAILV